MEPREAKWGIAVSIRLYLTFPGSNYHIQLSFCLTLNCQLRIGKRKKMTLESFLDGTKTTAVPVLKGSALSPKHY